VEFSGADKAALLPQLKQLVELMGDLGLPGSVVEMPDDARQKNLWEVRKAGLNIMMSLKGDGKPVSFIEDCAVPLEHLAEYTDALTEVFARYGSRGTWYAHASVGTLHVRPILDMRVDGAAKMRAIAEEASALVRKYKGAFSGEHGDGLCRGEWIEWQFGPAINEAFRDIKRKLDPIGLFNPGKIIDPPRMDDGALFRFAPPTAPKPYRRIALKPVLDWSGWNVNADPVTEVTTAPGTGGDSTGGLAKAVEMCNNNGHCRKFDAGTMCPSYRVTRDEQHLTRGRANTLRLALSGQLGPDAFTSEAMHDTMDLCVGCKGCKRDCPTGVDMAKMKVEFLDHYKKRHGHTLKDGWWQPARLRAQGQPHAVAAEPAQQRARRRMARREAAGLLGQALAARMAQRHLLARQGQRAGPVRRARRGAVDCAARRQGGGAVRRHLQRHLRERERLCRRARAAGGGLRAAHGGKARRAPLLRPHLSGERHGRRGEEKGRGAHRCAAAAGARGRAHRRAGALVPAHAARRDAGDGLRRKGRAGGQARAAVRGVHRARNEAGPLRDRVEAGQAPSCCTATATRRPSAR
jgi:ferredoxin